MPFNQWPVWAKSFAIAVLVAVLAWGWWMALRDTLCTIETKDLTLKRPIRGACLEFWLNRYQTLLSAFIGVGVALYVVRPVFRQLKEMGRQSAVGLRATYRERLIALEAEVDRYIRIARDISSTEKEILSPEWITLDFDTLNDGIDRLKILEERANIASTAAVITESSVASVADDLFAMLYNYIKNARLQYEERKRGLVPVGKSQYPMVDGEIVNLRDRFLHAALSLKPAIRAAKSDLESIERQMR